MKKHLALWFILGFLLLASLQGYTIDMDDDGDVDQHDLLLFMAEWHVLDVDSPADFFQDGSVDKLDLWLFAKLWDPDANKLDIFPKSARVLSGDTLVFTAIYPHPEELEWEFRVNGIVGGNASIGSIHPSSVNPFYAVYIAPAVEIGQTLQVTISVNDLNDPEHFANASVTVYPIFGELEIRPDILDIGLSAKQTFQAGIDVEGVGFISMNDVYWKVNGVLSGRADIGKINIVGDYKAPATMPGPLPHETKVGFSTQPTSVVLATADVTLSELHVMPKSVISLQAGAADILDVSIAKSDDTIIPVVPADLTFIPGQPDIATVNALGQVVIGDTIGKTVITVDHNATKARDTTTADSRSDLDIKVDIRHRSKDFARIERQNEHVSEIEFTRPGALFNVVPTATILRGQNAGNQLAGVGSSITFSVEGDNMVTFGANDPIPDPEGFTAAVDEQTGFVVVGNIPGRGTIHITYNDGFLQKLTSMDVIFSRVEMKITAEGHVTQSSVEALITEYVKVRVTFTNPNSDFIGDVPMRMTLVDEDENTEPYFAAFHRNRHTGNGVRFEDFLPFQFNEYTTFDLTADSSMRPEDFVKEPGVFELYISPKRDGVHNFKFEVRNDAGVEPTIVSINITKPEMTLQHPPPTRSNEENFIPDDSPVVFNSWVNVFHRSSDTAISPFDLVEEPKGNTFTRFAHNDVAFWTITSPEGNEETFPITDLFNSSTAYYGGTLNRVFDYEGQWKVRHGLKTRSEIQTEEFVVNVVSPQDVADVADSAILPATDPDPESSLLAPRSNQLGSFEILNPVGGGWAPGIPIPVSIQCYNALGQAGPIGKQVVAQYLANTSDGLKLVNELTHQWVAGIQVDFLRNFHFNIEGNLYPDSTGVINFKIVPLESAEENIGKDLILVIRPKAYQLTISEPMIAGLPTEKQRFIDGDGGVVDAAPFGLTSFSEAKYRTFNQQCLFVSGGGLAASPRQIPVPSERVRDALAADKIPEASGYAVLDFHGNKLFRGALSTGLSAISYSTEDGFTNVSVVGSEVIDNRILRATIDARFQETGDRFFKVVLGDESEWEVNIQFVSCAIAEPQWVNHSDKNLPLNGVHHNAHEVGSQQFDLVNNDFKSVLHKLELELVPSIKAGDTYKSAVAENPLVGFDREINEETGHARVFGLKQDFFQRNFSAFMVFGNTTDKRTLNPERTVLVADSKPDGLSDFVSLAPDAEKILVTLSGNMADYYEFAAYNIIAEVTQELKDPVLGFDDVKGGISTAYQKYSPPDDSQTLSQVSANSAANDVVVTVDKEAPSSVFDFGNNRFNTAVPERFYAGVLDQYYQAKLSIQTGRSPRRVSIGQDGRVRAFNGETSRSLTVTGRNRKGFGIELDALLFDPMTDGIFDVLPNSSDLLNLPIVNGANSLSNKGLLIEQGGTSGGYFDLDKDSPGSHQVVAKTPGQEYPGIHAGFLIQNTKEFLTDPYLDSADDPSIEDDIDQVMVKRKKVNGQAAGTAIQEESKFFKLFGQLTQRRRVHGFADSEDGDQKNPIATSLHSRFKYQVTTDPPGLEEPIPVIASLWLRELPRTAKEQVNLLVSTQSDGDEHLQEAAAHFVIDMAVNLASQVVLAALTGGTGNLACGGLDLGDAIFTSTTNFALSTTESEYFDNQLDGSTSAAFQLTNSVMRDGQSFLPYVDSVQVTVSDLVDYPTLEELKDLPAYRREVMSGLYKAPGKVATVGICSLINAPFEKLKNELKEAFTARGFGGDGAAQAVGERHLCISIPQSAWRGGGVDAVYSAEYSLRRVIQIIPDEEHAHHLQEEDFPSSYKTDSAVESDAALIERLLIDLDDPAKHDDAQQLLRYINRTAVTRESQSHSNIYRMHRFRYGRLPSFEVILTPRGEIDLGGKRIGDFMLKTDETAVDVATGSLVTASRSNENAGARAVLTSNGYDMRIIKATIPDPWQASPLTAKRLHSADEHSHGVKCGGGYTQRDSN